MLFQTAYKDLKGWTILPKRGEIGAFCWFWASLQVQGITVSDYALGIIVYQGSH